MNKLSEAEAMNGADRNNLPLRFRQLGVRGYGRDGFGMKYSG